MEEEQEELNNSLLALTSHFAQVQFRLKQIVDAPVDEKEDLLKSLEQFAFKGIPDARPCTSQSPLPMNDTVSFSEKKTFSENLLRIRKSIFSWVISTNYRKELNTKGNFWSNEKNSKN